MSVNVQIWKPHRTSENYSILKAEKSKSEKMPSLIMCKSLSDTHNGDSQTGRTQKLLR